MITYFTIAGILLACTVISSLPLLKWWVQGMGAMRHHLAVLMAMVLVWGCWFLSPEHAAVYAVEAMLIAGISYHAAFFFQFSPFYFKVEVPLAKNKRGLRFFAANVRMSNKHYRKLVALVLKNAPHVVLLTEVDQQWLDGVDPLKNEYPYTLLYPLDNTYGMALFSRFPLEQPKINFLVADDIPSFEVNLVCNNGQVIQYIGLHPKPPAPWTKEGNKELELIKAAGNTNYNSLPTVVSGDLNDVGWSKTTKQFKCISGMLDPRVGRGFFNTYNALLPGFRMPIDHFFVSHHFKLVKIKKLKAFGSDHFPVLLEVALEGQER